MLIRPKYIGVDNTPLAYLKFLKAVLPISVVLHIANSAISLQEYSDWYSIAFALARIIAVSVAAIGLNRMEWYGVILFYFWLAIPILDAAVSVCIYLYMGHAEEIWTPIGAVLGLSVWLIPSWIYFSKRRLLFDPFPKHYQTAIPKDKYQKQEYSSASFVIDEETGEVVKEDYSRWEETTPAQAPHTTPEGEQDAEQANYSHNANETKKGKHTYSPLDPPDEKTQRRASVMIAFICAFLIFSVLAGILFYQTCRYKQEINDLGSEISSLKLQITDLSKENDALYKEKADLKREKNNLEDKLESSNDFGFNTWLQLQNIGYIVDGSKYYHYYDCDVYTSADEYWAHNTEYCEYLGYKKCPLCWESETKKTGGSFIKLVPQS